ncbi:MAG TPA: prenyltransferase/squalene oxidase repeat-containing protein [Pseudonocardiaceae bacterium]|jgi:hypothetical protein|nr:prenyltransferase/squalene oxidase repeat-containing protein [Pseudonocardiaceae bacterium]
MTDTTTHRTITLPTIELPSTGVGSGEADLWCTYAAVRTLVWLGRADAVTDPAGTRDFLLGRANSDGGYAWTRGMPSDAWATFYCTQALTDLGVAVPRPERTSAWLRRGFRDGAFAMMPGQRPDVWATQFSTRTAIDVCHTDVPDRTALLDWLGGLQTADGGLSWSPEHAAAGNADVRACHYGITAWERLNSVEPTPPPWRTSALLAWLRGQRCADGGFRFAPDAERPCLWATYRASSALAMLGNRIEQVTVDWIAARRGPAGGYLRWAGYPVEDVWAAFCAVGSLRAAGITVQDQAPALVERIAAFANPGGGYTYREPALAADVLSTSAAVLTDQDDPRNPGRRAWLADCQLPNEGGLMYMPGRGAEVRCTLWGLAAGVLRANPTAAGRIVDWLRRTQNPDGGFGLWEGRGSELVSTAAAVDAIGLLGRPVAEVIDTTALRGFLAASGAGVGFRPVPAAEPTLRAGLQGLRILAALGSPEPARVASLLADHQVNGGGFANTGNRVPDLLSTYEAVLAADRHGIAVDGRRARRFVDRIRKPTSTAWSPLAPGDGGPLARCLGALLDRRLTDPSADLPALVLS